MTSVGGMFATREPILEQFLFICNLPVLGTGRNRPSVVAGMLFCISLPKARIDPDCFIMVKNLPYLLLVLICHI